MLFSAFPNQQFCVSSQTVYICCYDRVQAKGLAVSKREAKEEKKRNDFKQPRSKNLSQQQSFGLNQHTAAPADLGI